MIEYFLLITNILIILRVIYMEGALTSPGPQAKIMRIQFEIKEKLSDIINEIMHSDKWNIEVTEKLVGRLKVAMKDQTYESFATAEIYEKEVIIQTAWSKYTYRIYMLEDSVWCEYAGAYRGLLEQKLLPTLTPKEGLLESEVVDSSLFGKDRKKLREYAEENLKLKEFRRIHFAEDRNGTAEFDHPRKVYDEFIKEDYIPVPDKKK